MKKYLLIMMAFMASFSVYAQEVTKNAEEEVVAIANSSGDCWLILETLGSPKKDMCLYEIDTVKQIFINKEKEKLQKKHEEVVAYLEQLITNVEDKEKVKNIKETLETLNDVDLIIYSN